MKLHLPKITLETLTEKQLALYHNIDTQAYGELLAKAVAKKIVQGEGLFHAHRDYCGSGLFFYNELFTLGMIQDGYGYSYEEDIVATFESEEDFVQWLAKENDQSMSCYTNQFNTQPITKIRIDWFLEEHYSPVWNDYCHYIKERNT